MAIYRGTGGANEATDLATNQAVIAKQFAEDAANSATEANLTLDAFQDTYLGAKATAPTLDNDGNPIQVGALYFNTTTNQLFIRQSSGVWQLAAMLGNDSVYTDAIQNNAVTSQKLADNISIPGNFSTGGNLNLTGIAKRITGDFSNAAVANRLMFQNSVTNAGSSVGVMPNGTGANSAYNVFAGSDVANTSFAQLRAGTDTADVRINSNAIGTGTFLPMTFYTGGSERMRIDVNGNIGFGATTLTSKLQIEGAGANTAPAVGGPKAASIYAIDNSSFPDSGGAIEFGGVVNKTYAAIKGGLTDGAVNSVGYLGFYTRNAVADAAMTERMRIAANGNVLVTSPAGLGYGTGAGGMVTQATSKSTAVTLNRPTGKITVNGAALGAGTSVEFTLNNSLITINDIIVLSLSGSLALSSNYQIGSYANAGSAAISIRNVSAGTLSEAFSINFAIIKGATA